MTVMEQARPPVRPSTAARWKWKVSDGAVLVGRGMRHNLRTPDALLVSVCLPIMLLLLFVYVFGGAIEVGTEYINYVVPGIILLCAGFGAATTAVGVTNDMTTGVMDRFRSLPIANWTVVLGHVIASMARNLFATALVIGLALAIGFRPSASALEWLGVVGMVSLFILMMTWVSVMFGLIARTPDAANGFTFFILFLPYVSSAFVPTETMPTILHGFAEHQPVTPIIETVRGLLMGTSNGGSSADVAAGGSTSSALMDTAIGSSGWIALAWCIGILAVVIPVSGRLFRRRTTT